MAARELSSGELALMPLAGSAQESHKDLLGGSARALPCRRLKSRGPGVRCISAGTARQALLGEWLTGGLGPSAPGQERAEPSKLGWGALRPAPSSLCAVGFRVTPGAN